MASTSEDLFDAISEGDAARVRALLDDDPGLASARDPDGVSALMRARYRANRAVTDAVRRSVPDLDVFEAAAFADLARLSTLLADDPSLVDTYSADGFTALHFAAFFGKGDAVRLLLEHGAPVDSAGRGWMSGTALHSATSGAHTEVAALLLGAGADPDARQSRGWTPLHAAAAHGNASLARILLQHGADVDAVNDDGKSVRDLALEGGDAETIATLG